MWIHETTTTKKICFEVLVPTDSGGNLNFPKRPFATSLTSLYLPLLCFDSSCQKQPPISPLIIHTQLDSTQFLFSFYKKLIELFLNNNFALRSTVTKKNCLLLTIIFYKNYN